MYCYQPTEYTSLKRPFWLKISGLSVCPSTVSALDPHCNDCSLCFSSIYFSFAKLRLTTPSCPSCSHVTCTCWHIVKVSVLWRWKLGGYRRVTWAASGLSACWPLAAVFTALHSLLYPSVSASILNTNSKVCVKLALRDFNPLTAQDQSAARDDYLKTAVCSMAVMEHFSVWSNSSVANSSSGPITCYLGGRFDELRWTVF